jgi:hypothetical protein
VAGSVGYVFPDLLGSGVNFVTSPGLSYTTSKTDAIVFDDGSYLQLDDGKSAVGFVSASASKTFIAKDGKRAMSYFGTATYYDDFSKNRLAYFVDEPGSSSAVSLDPVGSYTEVSAGVNYTRVIQPGSYASMAGARQFNASFRVDARAGANMDSWGLTGQLRYQF